ncbi:hypothetical protein [Streptomyces sp. V1I6]|uniref:hypothetical protein n=1 Tax=Streptomyces sp. V1I6 TaxID=3042273 RepID=UPI0027D8A08B|nr:hypothetical protein [Streptomyces sp. V1I6]
MRIATGAAGVALMGVGVFLLLSGGQATDVVLWLAGAVVLHDLLLAPLVIAAGLLLARLPGRGPLRGALVTAGCLTLIALPVLFAPGTPHNPSVLPLDYPRNWLLSLAAVALATAAVALLRRLRGTAAVRRLRTDGHGARRGARNPTSRAGRASSSPRRWGRRGR